MPTYSFRCEAGCLFDATFRMAEVPAQTVCRECGAEATRVITTPHLSAAGKITITLCMFLGRLSPMTVVVALNMRRTHGADGISYPEERVIIG